MADGPLVTCIGEALIDFVAAETGADVGRATSFTKAQGGAVANVAMGLARLGVGSRFVGKVGADPFGRFLVREMEGAGVDVSRVVVSGEYPTGLVFVALNDDRVPSYIFFGDPSADMMLGPDEVGPEALDGASFLHLGTVSMVREPVRKASLKLARLAGELGVKVSFDPNPRLHLWKDHDALRELTWKVAAISPLLKLNDEELEFITGENAVGAGARLLRDNGAEVVVVTLGPQGAYYLCDEGGGRADGFEVEVKDTTGAGDGFSAGLLCSLAESGEWPPSKETLSAAVRFANAVAAMVTTEVGAVTALPSRDEVIEFMSKHGK